MAIAHPFVKQLMIVEDIFAAGDRIIERFK